MDHSKTNKEPLAPTSSIMLYTSEDNRVQLNVTLENETVWLTQKQLAELFDVKKAAISKHISNIYTQHELEPESTVSKMETVQKEGARIVVRYVDYYNLDMILSVGYRVNSKNAISFRRWSSAVLKDYIIKGYAVRENLQLQHYNELKDVVALMSRTLALQEPHRGEGCDGKSGGEPHQSRELMMINVQ